MSSAQPLARSLVFFNRREPGGGSWASDRKNKLRLFAAEGIAIREQVGVFSRAEVGHHDSHKGKIWSPDTTQLHRTGAKMKSRKPRDKRDLLLEELNVNDIPAGVDRRTFLMRSAVITSAVVITG